MKYLLILCFAFPVMAQDAMIRSPQPHLIKRVGVLKADGTYAQCIVTAGLTLLSDIVDGDTNVAKSVSKDNKLKADELKKLIIAAEKEKITRALHIVAAVPPVGVTAGISNQLKDFTLFFDSSDLQIRDGANSAKLLKIVDQECGKLKAPGQKREK